MAHIHIRTALLYLQCLHLEECSNEFGAHLSKILLVVTVLLANCDLFIFLSFAFAYLLFGLAALNAWLFIITEISSCRLLTGTWKIWYKVRLLMNVQEARADFPHRRGCRHYVQLFKGSCCCFALENSQKVLSNRPFHASKSGNGSVLRLVLSTPAVSTKVVTIIICLSISREVLVSFRSFARCLPYNQMLFSFNRTVFLWIGIIYNDFKATASSLLISFLLGSLEEMQND